MVAIPMRLASSILLLVVGLISVPLSAQPSPTLAQSRAACDAGDAGACQTFGFAVFEGSGIAKDRTLARSYFEKGCVLGQLGSCRNLAMMMRSGDGGQKDQTAARALLIATCEKGNFQACTSAAVMLVNGEGGPPDPAKARDLNRKACDGNESNGCYNLAGLMWTGAGGSVDKAGAVTVLRSMCKEAAPGACDYVVATAFNMGYGVTKDSAAARPYLQSGCDAGHGESCTLLGMLIAGGKLGAADQKAGLAYYEKGCALGEKVGCFSAGDYYLTHKPDISALIVAGNRLSQACSGGYDKACTYMLERSFLLSDEAVLHVLEQSCTLKNAHSCGELGDYVLQQTSDIFAARTAYEAQCASSPDGSACVNHAVMLIAGTGGSQDAVGGAALLRRALCTEAGPQCDALMADSLLQNEYKFPEDGSSSREIVSSSARSFLESACAGNHYSSCFDLASMYEIGRGGRKDISKALIIAEKACAGGYIVACKKREKLKITQ